MDETGWLAERFEENPPRLRVFAYRMARPASSRAAPAAGCNEHREFPMPTSLNRRARV
jgi:hypothetical protein